MHLRLTLAEDVPNLTRGVLTTTHCINHSIRAALHEADYSTTLKPSIMDPNPNLGDLGLIAGLLAFGIDGHRESYMDVAITCLTARTFLSGIQVRCGKETLMKFQQKCRKYAVAIRAEPGAERGQTLCLPAVCETFAFTHAKSAAWLGRQLKHATEICDRLLREISRTPRQPSREILEHVSRRLR